MNIKQKTTLVLMAAISTIAGTAQTHEQTDTIKVIENAQNITIISSGTETILTVDSPNDKNKFDRYSYKVSRIEDADQPDKLQSSDDMMFKLSFLKNGNDNQDNATKWKPQRYVTSLRYVCYGWNFNYGYKSGIKNSFEFSCPDIIGVDWLTSRYTTLGIGIGMGYTRVTSADRMLFDIEDGRLTTATAPEGADVDFARWNTWQIQVPLMFKQRLYKKFAVAVATIINFNTYSSATNRYTIDHTRYTEKITGLNQRLLTTDVIVTIGFSNAIGIYGKWSPITAMKSTDGPSFRKFSIGVNLNF
ncbi:MAG: hypothetical protein HDR82_02820 [Bacteroides sp.]|nr:hypothetical protein [Bacteroides sp.]